MENKVFLIGNAHIDPVWLWCKTEGLAEIKATFRSALDRMKEFDGYIFTSACASYYKWVEENEPSLFAEIQQRVQEGRWAIVGGFWVQPDCNIPSGESFARHVLYSQNYFFDKFGKRAEVGYNVDSFGHNGMLPQIYSKSGIHSYIFMRPNSYEKPNLQENLFLWESPDGSQILTYRIPMAYTSGSSAPDIEATKKLAEQEQIPQMAFYGVGNHGGGPTIRALQAIEPQLSDTVRYAHPIDYFKEVENLHLQEKLRVVKEDLQHHASGCYSANAKIKWFNRKAENKITAAEKWDVLSATLNQVVSNAQPKITAAWENILFNQFHDVLAGCSIRDAYEEAENAFAAACNTATEIQHAALQRISWNVNTLRSLDTTPAQKNGWLLWEKKGEGAPVVVFNPHSFPVKRPVKINTLISGVTDKTGKALPLQAVRGSQTNGNDRNNYIFMAEVPAFGYDTYSIYREEKFDVQPDGFVKAEGLLLENAFLKVKFDPYHGYIQTLMDKTHNRKVNSSAMAKPLVIEDSNSDTWGHNIFEYQDKIGAFCDAKIRVLDNGPIKATIRVTNFYNNSTLIQDFSLYSDSKEIEVKCKLDFHEKHKIVKLSFPIAIDQPRAFYSIPYGFIEKKPDGLEEPAQRWISVKNEEYGVAILNDGKYSFAIKDSEMQMNIARGCIYADHFGDRDDFVEYQDQGEQFFSYMIYPYTQFQPQEIVQKAAILNQGIEHIMETHHAGKLSPRLSGIAISVPNVIAETIKYAEKAEGIIVRFYETNGTPVIATVDCFQRNFIVPFHAHEIKTIFLPSDWKQGAKKVDLTEIEV